MIKEYSLRQRRIYINVAKLIWDPFHQDTKLNLWKDGRKIITAYDVMLTKLTSLTVKGISFNSSDKDVSSICHGYKYILFVLSV